MWIALAYAINPLEMNALGLLKISPFGGSVSACIYTLSEKTTEKLDVKNEKNTHYY